MRWALAVALSLACMSAPGASGAREQGGGLIRIFAITRSTEVVDVAPQGTGVGDQRVSGLILYDRHNRVIGNGYRVCVNLGHVLPTSASLCTVVISMPRGKIVCEGTRQRRDYYVLPIVGGTRLYSNARGSLIASTVESGPPRHERLLFSLE